MKISYVLGEDLELHPGLKNKIQGQVKSWEKRGHEVTFVAHALGVASNLLGHHLIEDESLMDRERAALRKKNRLYRLSLFGKQYNFLHKALKQLDGNITYGRYTFPFLGLSAGYGAGGPYILEINSDDLKEYFIKSRVTGIYNKLLRKYLLRGASGMVFVTNELAESPSFFGYKGKCKVIANGISTDDFPFVEDTLNNEPNLVFIGSPGQKWAGIEKLGIISKALPHARIHLVGPSKIEYLKCGGEQSNNIVFHGYLSDDDAKSLIAKMDVGISTLSLYEKKMQEACPLKSRQYLAQGVPLIGGYKDTDISEQTFYLQIPNKPDNVISSLDKIISFIEKAFRNRELRCAARSFAEAVLDVNVKEVNRIRFMEDVARSR